MSFAIAECTSSRDNLAVDLSKPNCLRAWSTKLLCGRHNKAGTSTVEGAASSTEVRLMAQIGRDLVQCYGPHPPKASLVTRLYALTLKQRSTFRSIKHAWQEEWCRLHGISATHQQSSHQRPAQQPWSDETLLRVSIWVEFDLNKAVKMLRNMPLCHWDNNTTRLTARCLAEDFASRSVMPLPLVTTKDCSSSAKDRTTVIYVRPARFFAVSDPLRLVTYTMNCMYDRYPQNLSSSAASCPLVLLVNLKGYYVFSSRQREKFGRAHWIALLDLLQGERGPLQAKQLWLVNAPAEFVEFWQTHLQSRWRSKDGFAQHVRFIKKSNNLSNVLESGCETYLPKDFRQGKASTRELVQDFLTYRKALEDILQHDQEMAQRRKAMHTKRIRQDLQEQQKQLLKEEQTQATFTEADSSLSSWNDDDEPNELSFQRSRRRTGEEPLRRRGSTGGLLYGRAGSSTCLIRPVTESSCVNGKDTLLQTRQKRWKNTNRSTTRIAFGSSSRRKSHCGYSTLNFAEGE